MNCDTCERTISIIDVNGCQCVYCYAPNAPRRTREAWERAGRPEPVVIVRTVEVTP